MKTQKRQLAKRQQSASEKRRNKRAPATNQIPSQITREGEKQGRDPNEKNRPH